MRRRLIENGKYQTVLPQTDHLILAGRVCPAGNPHARFGLSRDAFGLRRQRSACTPCLGWEDSNLQMSFPRCLLQLRGERSQVPQCSVKPKTIRPAFQWLTEN